MRRYYFFLLALSVFTFSSQAKAQEINSNLTASEIVYDNSHTANPQFEYMVRVAMSNMSDAFRFNRFRTLYVQTRQYDPVGDDTIAKMQELAFTVQNDKDIKKRSKALEDYRNLVMEHMANLRVVAQALSFAKLDSTFGSPRFFSWIRKGLIRTVLTSGDGKTLQSGYNIITMTEETVLIGQLGLRVLDTQVANEGSIYYNMHEVEDIRTGQVSSLFINTTRPMRHLNFKYKQSGGYNTFTIQRQ